MKKPLLNRLLILLSVVVSAAAVFGIVHFSKNRRALSTAVLHKNSSAFPDANAQNKKVEVGPQTLANSAQNAEAKKSTTQPTGSSSLAKKQKAIDKKDPYEQGAVTGKGEREQETVIGEDESGSGGRENWFYEQRAYPLKTIPRMARINAIEHMEIEERRLSRLRAAASGNSNLQSLPLSLSPWQSIGPKPIAQGQVFGGSQIAVPVAGRVSAIALDPGYNGTSNKTIYVGGAQGGVWRSTDNGVNWTPIMDDQASLAIGAIAIDPSNPNIIYVGTGEANLSIDSYYGAGLLKTTNGGASWTQIKGPPSPNVPQAFAFVNVSFSRIVIDPLSPSTVYVAISGTGATSGSTGGSGNGPLDQRGIWKSTDGGSSWTNLAPTGSVGGNSATDVLIDPNKHTRIYAAILSIGVFRLDPDISNGQWVNLETQTGSVLPQSSSTPFGRIVLAAGPPIAPATESTIYAAYANTSTANGGVDSGKVLGIFRSTDAGTTWAKLGQTPAGGQAFYNLTLAVDPTDANTIYFGLQSPPAFRSTDGGQTFNSISNGDGITGGLHADTHVMLVCPTNPQILFTGNDGGIWRSDNAKSPTISWNDLNQNLSITQFQGVALHPTNPDIILGGTQDNGTNLYGGLISWSHVVSGDGGITLIDQSNPSTMYHTFFNQTNTQIGPEISTSGGTLSTWRPVGCFTSPPDCSHGITLTDRVGFYAPMSLNTGFTAANNNGNGNVIYFGTQHLYRSSDQGTSWKGLGANTDGIGTDLAPPSGRLSAIAAFPFSVSSPSTEIVWIGTNNGMVQLTTNAGDLGGATFTNLTKAPLPNRFVTDIALDLTNSQRAIVTYSGFNTNTPFSPGHVFITNDLGNTFTDISGNLPDVPVTSIVIDPNNANIYYIGTDIGVFRTKDGGATWEALLDGMPKVAVFMLRYHAATKSLVAATHGRGMFTLDVSSEFGNPIPTVANIQPTSAAVQSGGFSLTVNGSSFVPGATVLWNGQARATMFNSGSQLTALILASDLFAAGTATVTVSNPAPGGGTAATSATFTITKANQTITFGSLPSRTFGDPPFTVNATASSQLVVTFIVFSGPATISGNTVTLTGAGNVTIRASQPGNANFNAAANVDQSFTVAKSNQTITFGTLANKTVGDPPFTISATASSSLAVSFSVISGNATVNGNTVTLTGTGAVTIQADQAGDTNFNAASPVQRSFTVAKGQASINLSNLVQIFDGNPKPVTATTTPPGLPGLTVTYNGLTAAPSAIGSYSVLASLNNANFQSPNSLGTLNIIGFSPLDSQNANPGGQNTATVNPSGNSPGISANLNHTAGGVTANISVGIYSGNPTERGLVNAGGGFVDVKVTSPNAGDTVVINYYYPNTVTPVNEAALHLYYFKGTVWLPVKGSGNSVPVKDTTDNLDGTVSGGKFTVTLDNTSSPKVSELTGTVFAATTAIMGDVNGDNVINVADLFFMANILAGNVTPTAVQKDAADVLKDANNNITVGDLLTLANFLAGNIKTLPLGN